MEYVKGQVNSQVATEKINEKSREEVRKQRKGELSQEKKTTEKGQRIRLRLIPIWVRLIMIAVLIALSAVAGVLVGYGVIGDGKPEDAFKKSTWQHIVDLVEKN